MGVRLPAQRIPGLRYSQVKSRARAVFGPIFQSALGGGKIKFRFFLYIGASETKRSRIFRYWLPQDILSKRQKNWMEGRTAPPPPCTLEGQFRAKDPLFNEFGSRSRPSLFKTTDLTNQLNPYPHSCLN